MRRARFGAAIAASNLGLLRMPYKVILALTYRCNGRCLICNIWKQKPAGEIAMDEIRTFFSRNSHLSWVNLTGGEIFLRKDLPDILNVILTECGQLCILNFATNGLLPKATERILEEMPHSAGVRTFVTVSVDGSPERNDRIRGVRGSFKRSTETFRRIRELNREDVDAYFGITVSHHNAGKLQETFRSLKAEIPWLEYEDIHLNVAHTSNHYYLNGAGGTSATSDILLSDIRGHYERQPRIPRSPVRLIEKRYLRHLISYLTTRRVPLPCQALSASCFVNPWGIVYPCIIYDRPLGSLREAGFDLGMIWCSPEASAARQEIREAKCPGCWTPCEAYQSILGGLLR